MRKVDPGGLKKQNWRCGKEKYKRRYLEERAKYGEGEEMRR
jgi:hypothetical protein